MTFRPIAALFVGCALLACGPPTPEPQPIPAPTAATADVSASPAAPTSMQALVAAPDRSEADRALDDGRHPAELLTFFGIQPGMRVAELMAGGGYTAELLARAVGPTGKVYGQNNQFVLERFAAKPWGERLESPVNANIVRVDRELEAPLPEDVHDLDAIFMVLFYHDSVWMETDRAKMNAAIFAALKPGGIYAIVDHSAAAGAGLNEVKTLHRIEEQVLRDEVLKAGFQLAGEASFLRNADDTRDWSASPSAAGERRGHSDRFVLKFVKPQ